MSIAQLLLRPYYATIRVDGAFGALWQTPVVQQCWHHNLASALTAEAMAHALGVDPNSAYTAGLLHDIGRLAMIVEHRQKYIRMLRTPPPPGSDYRALERLEFKVDHTEVGGDIAESLELPQAISDAVRHHHEPPASDGGYNRRAGLRSRERPMSRPPFPPFNAETAAQKARMAEDAWNTREPARVALAYTEDSVWRNRAEFLKGRAEIEAFLVRKWQRELDYRLIKEVWAFTANRIAVRFAYEWHDDADQWFRSYGNENWEFDENGLMQKRYASINDLTIKESDRLFHWPQGRRPDDHKSLSELGL